MQIGPYTLENRFILAPMAGVTDRPYRNLCRRYGAALAVSEMVSANPELQDDRKTLMRTDQTGETGIRSVQILGNVPKEMALAAKINADRGAHIIDINMGCPAKKVCKKAAGSALLRDEPLVRQILEAVVSAVDLPVTLKIRTGWDPENRNALTIARIAEGAGIKALTIHGRTRACGFSGSAEYRTIGAVKAAVNIPVIANGDIDSPSKAVAVLEATGADAVMIGRAALGQPWLFRALLATTNPRAETFQPDLAEVRDVVLEHLEHLHSFYGAHQGVRIARKHIGWYFDHLPPTMDFKKTFNTQESTAGQYQALERVFAEMNAPELA
jgi:tRNA-dihydrouridine synthase B